MDFSIATLANVMHPKKEKSSTPGTLDKDAFLQILTTQLRYQDPTSPMDTDSFITQMSQFSMMEQLINMASVMEGMAQASVFSDATSVIGKEVKLVDAERGEIVSGVVEKVSLGNGAIEVEVNGRMYNFTSVYEVKNLAEIESPGAIEEPDIPAEPETPEEPVIPTEPESYGMPESEDGIDEAAQNTGATGATSAAEAADTTGATETEAGETGGYEGDGVND